MTVLRRQNAVAAADPDGSDDSEQQAGWWQEKDRSDRHQQDQRVPEDVAVADHDEGPGGEASGWDDEIRTRDLVDFGPR